MLINDYEKPLNNSLVSTRITSNQKYLSYIPPLDNIKYSKQNEYKEKLGDFSMQMNAVLWQTKKQIEQFGQVGIDWRGDYPLVFTSKLQVPIGRPGWSTEIQLETATWNVRGQLWLTQNKILTETFKNILMKSYISLPAVG